MASQGFSKEAKQNKGPNAQKSPLRTHRSFVAIGVNRQVKEFVPVPSCQQVDSFRDDGRRWGQTNIDKRTDGNATIRKKW